MKTLIDFFEQHQAAATVAVAWLVREWHAQWPRLVAIYPGVVARGGVIAIVKAFFVGQAELGTNAPPGGKL